MTTGYRDFLDEANPIPASVEGSGMGVPLIDYNSKVLKLLTDIRLEMVKQSPSVLAFTRVQGDNTIKTGDISTHRVFFEVGGKPVTIYQLLAYSTFKHQVAISVEGMNSVQDGIIFGSGDVIVLPVAADGLYVVTDGIADCPINQPSIATGGFFMYGFTIPDYEARGF